MILDILKALAFSGGDWVIWALLACSVLAAATIIERALFLRREEKVFNALRAALLKDGAGLDFSLYDGAAARILSAVPREAPKFPRELLAVRNWEEKLVLENRLLILGTLGSNAPFIGLLGTVLGVIKAFHDLSQSGAGPEMVMKGLSEALIATALGLFVAIPCVVGYNYFQKKVQDILSGTESLAFLLAHGGSKKAA